MTSDYEYVSHSSTKGGADTGGLFEIADTNNDGVIDRAEFANLVGGHHHHSTSYELTSGYDVEAIRQAARYTADSNPAWCRYGAEVRGTGLYVDHHPEIIHRHSHHGVQTVNQHIRVRFLQPPPVPPPGPLIIKEVRPPQPPALPPLRIKQVEAAVAELPPLVLRERPPLPPAPIPSQTVIRNLPALPVPPRSVIIERYAAAAVRPRDIIIERWLPYGSAGERKTIVQRADAAITYAAPRNVIIEYEAGEVRVHRQFHNLGVTQENPKAYLARYGDELLDSHTLLHRARSVGVHEDISTPLAISGSVVNSLAYSSDASHGFGDEVSLVGGSGVYVGGSHVITGSDVLHGGSHVHLGSDVHHGGSHVHVGGTGGYRTTTYESSSYS